MVSQYEVLEYLNVFGESRSKDLIMTFGPYVCFTINRLIAKQLIVKFYPENSKRPLFKLSTKAIKYLEYKKLDSFIDGNQIAEKMEQKRLERCGKRFWRPWGLKKERK